jgi:ABC-2 type transport system ATP-binding protein
MSMLVIENVSKTYNGKVKACDGINLTIEGGDIYGFVGHNGAGKTTLLKAIAGIIEFDEGTITIDGKSIKTQPLQAKKVLAYIPDNPDVYDSLTGIQYLNFIGDVFSVTSDRRRELIEKYARKFEIIDNLNQPISSYSLGMKQKIIIISALIHEPRVLLLDEPFVGLDPKASYLLKELFKEMCKEGVAIFFSTHVLEVVEKLCNKIAIIKKGKIVVQGDTISIIKDKSLEKLFMEILDEQ